MLEASRMRSETRFQFAPKTLSSSAILELHAGKTCLYAPFVVPYQKFPLKMR